MVEHALPSGIRSMYISKLVIQSRYTICHLATSENNTEVHTGMSGPSCIYPHNSWLYLDVYFLSSRWEHTTQQRI